jgi:hypothetical protein
MSAFLKNCPVKGLGGRNLVKYTVYNSCICSPHNLIPSPLCYILYKYIDLYLFTQVRGGGGGEPVRRLEGQYFTRGVENTNMTD